jgi:hypothetical protein
MNQKQKDENERNTAEQNPDLATQTLKRKDHAIGTFGGEEDHVVRTRKGESVPGDTGDQGGRPTPSVGAFELFLTYGTSQRI